jgi:hypothetical protein
MNPSNPDGIMTVALRLGSSTAKDIIPALLSGKYERIGGVVRDSLNKQIVAWLREVPGLDSTSELVRVLAPLAQGADISEDEDPYYFLVPQDSPLYARAAAAKKRLSADAQ